MWHAMGELLRGRLSSSQHLKQITAAQTLDAFSGALAEQFATDVSRAMIPEKLVAGVLTVRVSHPGIAQLLSQQKPSLLAKLKAKGHSVRDLLVVVGSRPSTEPSA